MKKSALYSFVISAMSLVGHAAYADVINLKVTASGGKYFLNGERTPVVEVQVGDTVVFDLTDSSVRSHPLYLTERADSRAVFAGAASNNQTITLDVTEETPAQLFYSCSRHANMGGTGSIVVVDGDNN